MKLLSKLYKKILLIIMAAIAILAGMNSGCSSNSVQPLYGVDQDSTKKDSIIPLYGPVPEYGVRGAYFSKPAGNDATIDKDNVL